MKSMILTGILMFGGFGSFNAFADSACEKGNHFGPIQEIVDSLQKEPVPCLSLQETPKDGVSCKTEQGVTFTRVSDGWKDEKSKKRWLDEVGYGNHEAAEKHCAEKMEASLPGVKELDDAYNHGISEVLELSLFYSGKPDSRGFLNPTFWTHHEYEDGECLRSILGKLKEGQTCPKAPEKSKLDKFMEKHSKKEEKDTKYWSFDSARRQFGYASEKYSTAAESAICIKEE
jgi:hypothetical protein